MCLVSFLSAAFTSGQLACGISGSRASHYQLRITHLQLSHRHILEIHSSERVQHQPSSAKGQPMRKHLDPSSRVTTHIRSVLLSSVRLSWQIPRPSYPVSEQLNHCSLGTVHSSLAALIPAQLRVCNFSVRSPAPLSVFVVAHLRLSAHIDFVT